jgi:dihydroxyacetone kinase-like protein
MNERTGENGVVNLSSAVIVRWLRLAASAVRAERDHLTALDAAIGDADHGHNLDRGFTAVEAKLPEWEDQSPGAILAGAGRVLLSTVGGASGVLYGTALMGAGAAMGTSASCTPSMLLGALETAEAGLAARGHAVPGEKTLLDAWHPAVEALRLSLAAGQPLAPALASAAQAAGAGSQATILFVATKGRAANLGPRSAGHEDPGAASTALLFLALARAARVTALPE